MLAAVLASATQLRLARAAAMAARADLPTEASRVVYLGMGGSGIAGDALAALASTTSPAPIRVVKDYVLPAFASGPDTLVIACSYSGETEETRTAFAEARARGCRLVVITGGGSLAAEAAEAGAPVMTVPLGMQPRAAFPSLLAATLTVAEAAGLLPALDAAFEDAAIALDETVKDADPSNGGGFPMELARRAHGRHVHVWGMPDLSAVVADRWKNQIQENAQSPASVALLPELNHNEIMSYMPGERTLEDTLLVVLRHDGEHPRTALRAEISLELVRERVGDSIVIRTHAPGDLPTLLDLAVTGDLMSVYLAYLREVDPSPVEIIGSLKRRLAGA